MKNKEEQIINSKRKIEILDQAISDPKNKKTHQLKIDRAIHKEFITFLKNRRLTNK